MSTRGEVDSTERRAAPRDAVRTGAVRIRALLPTGRVFEGTACDVSETGVRILGDTDGLEVGSTVVVTFIYPVGSPHTRRCVVKRITPGEHFAAAFAEQVPDSYA